MNRLFLCLATIFLIVSASYLQAQSARIALDGVFDDWTSDLVTIKDTPESIPGIDLIEMQVTNDEQFLFIKIKTNLEFDLTDDLIPQKFRLSFDTDNNQHTGYPVQPGFGSELQIVFFGQYVHYNVDPYVELTFSDISLRVSPTVTANEFEIAIKRDVIPDGTHPLFTVPTIKILLHNNLNDDKLPDEGSDFLYTFDETPLPPLVPIDIMKEDTTHIRILAYNTKGNGLNNIEKLPYFENIITILKPDIIGLSECGNTGSSYVKDLLNDWLPLSDQEGWFTVKKPDEDLITASRWPIIGEWNNLPSQFPTLIDLPDNYPTDLLFTNAHLKWGNGDDIRQDEVDAYIAFLLDAKTNGGIIDLAEGTPFVYGGDLNLVGYAQQLTTLLKGEIQNTSFYGPGGPTDWNDTDITAPLCLQTDKGMDYTWRNENSIFPPGKLDYIIYSDAVMNVEKTFVIQTEVMPPDRLELYGFNQNDTKSASDHFPVIADFSINETISITEYEPIFQFQIFPNPSTNNLNIKNNNSDSFVVIVSDIKGQKCIYKKSHKKKLTLDINNLKPGIYYVKIISDNGNSEIHKLIKF